ncbi:MAG: DUF3150 domain-containing protein [Candidatus Contendobacter sp.]|nr:DUF3150 domain-containing protein [Candidatus Contendobacter sp.]
MSDIVPFGSISDRVVFIHLQIVCWTASQRLRPEDLGLDRRTLPPERLVHFGNKKLINPEELRPFASLRSAARRECLAVGVRFLGGFLVPADQAQRLLDRLDALERRFGAERDRFLARFDHLVEDWIREHPDWAALIRGAMVPARFVAERLSFAAQALQLTAPGRVTHAGLARAAAGLADTLFREVATLAQETLERSFLGRTVVTRRALRPVLALRDKLAGLAFLDVRVRPLVDHLEQTLGDLPRQGAIQGRDLDALLGLLAILENPERLKAHGDRLRALPADAVALGALGQPAFLLGAAAPHSAETITVRGESPIRVESDADADAVLPDPEPPSPAVAEAVEPLTEVRRPRTPVPALVGDWFF